MTELERYQGAVIASLLSGSIQKGQPIGYTAPAPVYVTVQDSRIGAGTGTSQYPGFQTEMQNRVAALANNTFFRTTATPDLVALLLGQTADDAVSNLGDADPDCANRDALLQTYIQVYNLAVTIY